MCKGIDQITNMLNSMNIDTNHYLKHIWVILVVMTSWMLISNNCIAYFCLSMELAPATVRSLWPHRNEEEDSSSPIWFLVLECMRRDTETED